jgi:hypothetical protein
MFSVIAAGRGRSGGHRPAIFTSRLKLKLTIRRVADIQRSPFLSLLPSLMFGNTSANLRAC